MQLRRINVDSPGSAGVTGQEVAVQPGDQITFGGWAYLESGSGGNPGWWLAVSDASHHTFSWIYAPNPPTTSSGWTFQSGTYTVPSGAAYVSVYAQINQPSTAVVLRVDDGFLYNARTGVTLADNLDYLPFGEQISGSSVTTHKFTSDERDSETSLDHTWFRQYSSSLGRWTTADPFGLKAVNPAFPQTWNLYAYVLNNPLNGRDPTGRWCVWEDGTHDDNPEDGGAPKLECEEQGGTWDGTDTIGGLDENGRVVWWAKDPGPATCTYY